jgi:hypothetical protein
MIARLIVAASAVVGYEIVRALFCALVVERVPASARADRWIHEGEAAQCIDDRLAAIRGGGL